MTDRDPAFLWETAAMRSASQRRARESTAGPSESGALWVTLRDGHRATGIPVETLRKWARRNSVPSYLEDGPFGTRRMVDLVAVHRRAHALDRTIAPVPEPPSVVEAPPPAAAPAPDLPKAGAVPAAPPPEPPPGAVIVPIDAWDKMLLQLGNLHQAGQQLAEARERAGKAETEARFLRERLAEMRQELERRGPGSETVTVPEPGMAPATPSPPVRLPPATRLWLQMVRRMRAPRR
jgi:hypothetical protein